MSELIGIWNNQQLTAATPPPSFTLPNVPGCSLKINNQSRYWLKVMKAQTGQTVDKLEPFSFLILPNVKDISLEVDTSHPVSSLTPDTQMVDYATMKGAVQYQKGSTQFNGAANVNVAGDVNIKNSTLDVEIIGTPEFNIAPGQEVNIGNTPDVNVKSGSVVIESGEVNVSGVAQADIQNEQLPTTQIYNGYAAKSVNTGVASMTYILGFLPNGKMIETHRARLTLVSAKGVTYTITNAKILAAFQDGHTIQTSNDYPFLEGLGPNDYMFGTAPSIGNQLEIVIELAGGGNFTVADNITIYWQLDGNDTAIDTQPGYGVSIQPASDLLNNGIPGGAGDAGGGSIVTGGTSQQLLSQLDPSTGATRTYFFIQNTHASNMLYFSIGKNATMDGMSINIPPMGSMVFESGFVPLDSLHVNGATGTTYYFIYKQNVPVKGVG